MFYLRLFEKVIVATKANLPLIALHFYGEARFMAFVALLVFIWRMDGEMCLGSGSSGNCLRDLSFIERFPILVIDNSRSIRRSGDGNAVEEEIKPPLFGLSGATGNHSQTAKNCKKTFERSLPFFSSAFKCLGVHLAWWGPAILIWLALSFFEEPENTNLLRSNLVGEKD